MRHLLVFDFRFPGFELYRVSAPCRGAMQLLMGVSLLLHASHAQTVAPFAMLLLLLVAGCDQNDRTPTADTDAGWDAGSQVEVDAGWDAGPEPSYLFGPCTVDEQCPGAGAFCRKSEEGWPQGYCTVPCEDRGPCDDGFRYNHCVEAQDESGKFCELRCLNGADCSRDGYTCVGMGSFDRAGSGICIGLCDEDTDCEPGGECNEWAGACVAVGETPTEGSETGGPCADDEGCLGGNCLAPYTTGFTGWAGGYCMTQCILPMGYNTNTFYSGDALPPGTCAGDSVCFPNGSYTRGDVGVCLRECTTDADCRQDEGYTCLKEYGLPSGDTATYTNGVCLPMDCQSTACPVGYECRMLASGSSYVYRCESAS